MQFEWNDGATTYGYAVSDAGPNNDEAGFQVGMSYDVEGGDDVAFTIPELRQMLAEAEMAEKDISDCDCANCDCQTLAPLADEEELAEDFEDRVEKAVDDRTEDLLTDAERAIRQGNVEQAKAYLELVYVRRNLLS